ncbi:hypothetical protein [Corynebacterium pygosceleis]|uniref:hypothetical protein n=1 Tax=Corynebacterium pygosceleis TaxID=2800406 RepID=UPI001903F8C2|nr:hypothetical protein [Corynebacterium pygosceleis]MCK7676143.1 hypothetical protein [Corynebacterium pygosceleis]MCL0120019.1 hypothetical protein [Corynebacterium pygosceleis]
MIPSLYAVTPDTVSRMHPAARESVFWELDPATAAEVVDAGSATLEKEAWINRVLLEQGGCGYSIGTAGDAEAIATVLFCAPEHASGVVQLPTAPVSPDAQLLTSLFIERRFGELGVESVLINAVILDLTRRGARAVEAFALRNPGATAARRDRGPRNPSGDADMDAVAIAARASEIGLPDIGVLEAAGFAVVADHDLLPRLRLSLPGQDLVWSEEAAELPLVTTPG